MALNEDIIGAVANGNLKNLGDFPSLHFQQMMLDSRLIHQELNANFVRGNNRLNGALDALIIRGASDLAQPDMMEAMAAVKMGTGVDPQSQGHLLAQALGQLATVIAASQQLMKGAQTTIPVTGGQNAA